MQSGHPERIGPYRILGVLGEGGMGTVYSAEQREPVRRLVALKVVQAGVSTKDVLARFQLERRALAAMNHRCIAKVFDAGATDRGDPYFVMELVEGLPITEYCDRHRLSLAARLQLFQQVCDGVQHAHLKGIVHRDLKPNNVLVVREGDQAVAKILDFGLAKATNRGLVDVTIVTEKHQVLGTLEYMAPEQAAGDGEAIDARADVYSLGVMLYELGCGELPFPSATLRKAGYAEALRLIREEEPKRPSVRLAARPDSATVAHQRQTSSAALRRALASDLDWIVLRAMAKEPERRYDATTSLAADIARYLAHQPVLAGPPSASYRLRKFLRRYRGQVLAAAAVVATAIGGAVVAADYAQEAIANAAQIGRQKEDLEIARDAANRREMLAEGRRLLALAVGEQERDPELALLLAIEGTLLAPGAEARSILADSMLAANCLRSFDGHRAAVTRLAFSGDGRTLFTGDEAGVVIGWEYATGRRLGAIDVHRGAIVRLCPDHRGENIATASARRSFAAWRTDGGDRVLELDAPDWPCDLEPAADGRGFVLRTLGGPSRSWTWDGNERPSVDAVAPRAVALREPAGRWFLGATSDGERRANAVLDASGEPIFHLPDAASDLTEAAADAAYRLIATVNGTSRVHVWDTARWLCQREFVRHDTRLSSVRVSPDARWLLAFGPGQLLYVWNLTTGELHFTLDLHRAGSRLLDCVVQQDSTSFVFAARGQPVRSMPFDVSAAARASPRKLSTIEQEIYGIRDRGAKDPSR